MKVLNLRCAHGHLFEGWFASDDDFLDQNGRGMVGCPLCGDLVIQRMPTAPRLNLAGAREPAATDAVATGVVNPPADLDMQALWLQAVRHVLATTEDVGVRFADEARRIHYGDAEHRGIRGQASAEERVALADEGIEVMPLPLPAAMKGPSH